MVKIDRSVFIEKFKEEASEHLQKLNEGIITLESEPDNEEVISELMRSAHTLKGSSKMVGLLKISEIAHKVEDLFLAVKDKKIKAGSHVSDAIFNALDAILYLVNEAAPDKETDFDNQEIIDELDLLLEKPDSDEKNDDLRVVKEKKKETEEDIKEEERETEKSFKIGDKTEEKIKDKIKKTTETIRVKTNQIDTILNLVGEIVINQIKAERRQLDLKNLNSKIDDQLSNLDQLKEIINFMLSDTNGDSKNYLDSSIERLKASIIESQKASLQIFKNYGDDISQMNIVVNELQEKSMVIRMLPISTIFNKYPRAVRDLAKEFEKKVNLVIKGETTELDKKVLEEINDPLIHLVRNSVDHGIEKPEERKRLGKKEVGQLILSASHEGDHILIEISDDGRGIDPEKIKQTAIKKGYINEDEASGLDEQDILYLIFESGFSTSTIITDVSGRGVGMDIVKKKIEEELKGSVKIESNLGKGVKYTLMLPLTLAIIRALLIKVGDRIFAIPTTALEETIKINQRKIQKIKGKEAFQLRGNFIPLVSLSNILGLKERGSVDGDISIVIINSGGRRIGFKVQDLIFEQQIVIKTLGNHLKKVTNIAGTTILGEGEIVLILHIPDLIKSAREIEGLKAWYKKKKGSKQSEVKILVVEDSLTTRELEKSIFEAAGYQVDLAINGQEALSLLDQKNYDLVVTDIQMPLMDGFELTKTIKENDKLKQIPVVILTSLENDTEKQKGIEVGADAYIVKSTFDQASLLNTINRLT